MIFRPDFSQVFGPSYSELDPEVGDVFWVPKDLYDETDDRLGHPFVVIREPSHDFVYVGVLMRTSNPDPPTGPTTYSSAKPEMDGRLDKDGWWLGGRMGRKSISAQAFSRKEGVERIGELSGEELDRVMKLARRGTT